MDTTRIDYVIVLDRQIRTSRKLQYIDNFIKYLEKCGIKLSIKHENIKENVYITVQLSERGIQYFAYMYDINISNSGHTPLPKSTMNFFETKYFHTPISGEKDLLQRDGTITNKERILVVQAILNEAQFGDSETECGLEKLIRFGIAKTAYPLHDGDYLAAKDDSDDYLIPENDRQLLLKYWANSSLWYKEQPLNLIEKYFGTEVAFYFAWLGFYNRMLIPAAVVGLIISVASILHWLVVDHERVGDICESNLTMCPLCHSGRNCFYTPLKQSCDYSKISIVFDNSGTVLFAVFMSFWATLYLNLWQRFENTLKIRWNVEFEVLDTKCRVAYKEKCTHKRWSKITGVLEPYVPLSEKVTHYILSYTVGVFLILVNFLFTFGVIMYRVSLRTIIRMTGSAGLAVHGNFILQATSACLQVAFIKLFELFYTPLAVWLTDLENPRTQSEYDNGVIQKIYIMSFVNNYGSLFYIAFVKGRFYSPHNAPSPTRAENDLCHATGCLMSLCLQLSVLMLLKSMISNILSLAIPSMRRQFKALYAPRRTNESQLEKEYRLYPSERFLHANAFMQMIIQYGFVTFFVAAFPLAPLLALINNCLELRLEAYQLVVRYRRPDPKQYSGIGAWNRILRVITHLSIATNAFVLAFTSDFVTREMYKYGHNNSLDGYIRSTLSLYDMRDYEKYKTGNTKIAINRVDNSTLCYYPGHRHPPKHPLKYELTPHYWQATGMKLLCVIVFEHIILITNGFLSYVIPDIPQTVKDTLHYHRTQELENKLKIQADDAKKLRRRKQKPKLQIHRSFVL